MNNEDMSELFGKFSNMVKEGNIPDEMKSILSSLSSNSSNESNENSDVSDSKASGNSNNSDNNTPSIDFETILKMKSIMEKLNNNNNDPRSNLLLSLKPYLKDSRKEKIDQYIKLFGMSKVLEVFNSTGGDVQK